jgi:Spy/CpxP family protein refolding chaperone
MKRMNFEDRRKQRREEAEVRQAEYDALTPEQKVARVKTRPGNNKRELIRLNAYEGD